ncbi:MAG TPA: alkaline phosphatase D family protein [Marmoricola sp.]|nr:alkaline phosphatase D family protein [Marmoricola sp.]
MPAPVAPSLVLGPLLRHVDESSAAVWVETTGSATVTVRAGDRSWSARTFRVHDHHYALVSCEGLEPGTVTPYSVLVDDSLVWPPPDPASSGWPRHIERAQSDEAGLPPSVIATLTPGKPLRLAFGSCRTSVAHDEKGNRTHGIDALRAYALALGGVTQTKDELARPDLLLFLGDQVYADETTQAMQEFIESRRDIDEPPGKELADYAEYAHLYRLAWSDPANRWLLSTLPSAMIFDDHDIRDDWNTSAQWRREMEATSWWHGRIVAGLASYWVYQHLGNLSPAARAEDEIWRLVLDHEADDELDLTEALDEFAERVDKDPSAYRWSYAREFGRTRLVVVDSRAARVLEDDRRSLLDPTEMAWLDEQMRGDVEHLLVGTSLPFLLPQGLHHLEAFSEALAGGAWGKVGGRFGERLRQAVDLEHWGAFQHGFREVAEMALEVATGKRGAAPRTVTFLSGDVHHSYVSQVTGLPGECQIVQAVCSPIRNPLPRSMRFATAALSYGIAGPMGLLAARSAKVPDPPFRWNRVRGPWFDNNLAELEVTEDGLHMSWGTGEVEDGRHDRPLLRTVSDVVIDRDGRARTRRRDW